MGTNSSPRAHSVASHGEQEPPLRTKPVAHTHAHPSQASVSSLCKGAQHYAIEEPRGEPKRAFEKAADTWRGYCVVGDRGAHRHAAVRRIAGLQERGAAPYPLKRGASARQVGQLKR